MRALAFTPVPTGSSALPLAAMPPPVQATLPRPPRTKPERSRRPPRQSTSVTTAEPSNPERFPVADSVTSVKPIPWADSRWKRIPDSMVPSPLTFQFAAKSKPGPETPSCGVTMMLPAVTGFGVIKETSR